MLSVRVSISPQVCTDQAYIDQICKCFFLSCLGVGWRRVGPCLCESVAPRLKDHQVPQLFGLLSEQLCGALQELQKDPKRPVRAGGREIPYWALLGCSWAAVGGVGGSKSIVCKSALGLSGGMILVVLGGSWQVLSRSSELLG